MRAGPYGPAWYIVLVRLLEYGIADLYARLELCLARLDLEARLHLGFADLDRDLGLAA
jgi:hypothetical protein